MRRRIEHLHRISLSLRIEHTIWNRFEFFFFFLVSIQLKIQKHNLTFGKEVVDELRACVLIWEEICVAHISNWQCDARTTKKYHWTLRASEPTMCNRNISLRSCCPSAVVVVLLIKTDPCLDLQIMPQQPNGTQSQWKRLNINIFLVKPFFTESNKAWIIHPMCIKYGAVKVTRKKIERTKIAVCRMRYFIYPMASMFAYIDFWLFTSCKKALRSADALTMLYILQIHAHRTESYATQHTTLSDWDVSK